MPTIKQILEKTNAPRVDAEIIISKAIKKSKSFVLSYSEHKVDSELAKKIIEDLKQREKGIPLAQILNEKEFFGLPFFVSKDTLIPRPATETLVEKALPEIIKNKLPFVDIGTGSGCIAITIATKSKNIHGLATDISKKAIKIAKLNTIRHKVSDQISILRGHLSEPIYGWTRKHKIKKPLILIANLPYVSKKEYSLLDNETKHDPKKALVAKSGGLALYKELLKEIEYLESITPIHSIYFEISPMQKERIRDLVKYILPHRKIKVHKDLEGHDRVIEIR